MERVYRNPLPTVDVIIQLVDKPVRNNGPGPLVLVYRKNPPHGWALPGGFVDYGETLEEAAVREALEETSLRISLIRQFHTYSDPARDPRHHTITTVFIASASGDPVAGDDAGRVGIFFPGLLPAEMAFDHAAIVNDYLAGRY